MTLLSREVARWLQSNPGPIWGSSDADVFATAFAAFKTARRWKQEDTVAAFSSCLDACGYKTTTRRDWNTDGAYLTLLPLPEAYKGF